jgi:hypothetical protein
MWAGMRTLLIDNYDSATVAASSRTSATSPAPPRLLRP